MNCTYASRSTTIKNSAEFFKIALAKTRWWLQLVEPAMVVKRYNSGRKRTISDVKQYRRDWFKRHKRVFLEDKIFQSWLGVKLETGLMKVPATGILLHIFVYF